MNIRAWLKIEDKYILQCRLNVEPFTDHLTTASVTWFDINYWKTIEIFLKPLLKQCLNHLKESEVNVKFFGATPYDIDDISVQLKYELKRRNELNNTVVQPKSDKAAWKNVKLEEKEYLDCGGLFESVIVLDYVLYVSIKKIGTLQKNDKVNEVNLKEETSTYFQNNQNSNLNSLETLKSSLPHMKYEKKKRKCVSKIENKSDHLCYESNKELKIDQFLTTSSSPEEKFRELKLDNPMEVEDISLLPTYTTCSQTDEFLNPKKVKHTKHKKKTKESKIFTQKTLNKYFETEFINHSKSETKSDIKDFSLSPELYETSTNKIIERPDPYCNDSHKENLNINFAYSRSNSFFDVEDTEDSTKCDDLVDFRDKLRENKLRKIKKAKNLSMKKVAIDKNKTNLNTLKCINTNAEENDFKFAEKNCKNITSEEEISEDQLAKLKRLFNDIVSHKAPEKDELSFNSYIDENMVLDNENDKELASEEKPVENCEWLGKVKKTCLKNIIKKNWSKLKDIECGRAYSRRHQDYFRGGRAKIDLTFQVHVSQFTEKQIDYIMNLLIPEFYKGGYEDMDYILKVILPETLIIIYMELYGTTHKESDRLMSEAVFKVCSSD